MYVNFSISEKDVMGLNDKYGDLEHVIKEVAKVNLQLSNGNMYTESGKVESISGIVDVTTGSVSIRAVFPNPKGQLLSGGAGSIILPYTDKQAILIPQESTFEIQDKIYVYKIIDGKTTSTIIDVHKINNGKEYIVREGLNIGDIIVAKGAGLVNDGILVKTQE